jgi:hypothetical protein
LNAGSAVTKKLLSPKRRRLVELMQEIHFGRIERFLVVDAEPVLDPAPYVVREVLFGKTSGAHAKRGLEDFALKEQVLELFTFFDHKRSFKAESLVVQNGLPLRMTVAEERWVL